MFYVGDRVTRINSDILHTGLYRGEQYVVSHNSVRDNGKDIITLRGYGYGMFYAENFILSEEVNTLCVCSTDYMLNKNLNEEDKRIITEAMQHDQEQRAV